MNVHDELWRAENPGKSFARGMLCSLAVSVAMWGSIGGIVWALIR